MIIDTPTIASMLLHLPLSSLLSNLDELQLHFSVTHQFLSIKVSWQHNNPNAIGNYQGVHVLRAFLLISGHFWAVSSETTVNR